MTNRILLGLGPMSKNITDAIIEYSKETKHPILLVASRRQIEAASLGGGYVNGWTTETYADYVRSKRGDAPVILGRDHGGPWQGGESKELTLEEAMAIAKESYEVDIRNGFEVIHIDTSSDPDGLPSLEESLRRAFELWDFCEEVAEECNNPVKYIIGAEDADGKVHDLGEFREFLDSIRQYADKHGRTMPWYVLGKTGTFTRETQQAGVFDKEIAGQLSAMAAEFGTGIQEHNGDYETLEHVRLRKSAGIAAYNVAPEFGVEESRDFVNYCRKNGFDDVADDFISLAYDSRKWEKWLILPDTTDRLQKAMIAGHYTFGLPEFAALRERLPDDGVEFDALEKQRIKKLVAFYDNGLND